MLTALAPGVHLLNQQQASSESVDHLTRIIRIHKRISSRTSNRFPHKIRHKCRKLFIYGSLMNITQKALKVQFI
jgi:hypothetical protein